MAGRPRNPLIDELAAKEPGSITILVRGEHYDRPSRHMQGTIVSGLAYRGIRCSTRVVGETIAVTIIGNRESN